jgi:two-component system, sensor histidine kinase and response regulator
MKEDARVLIVDDDPGLLQALSEMLALRMRGLSVETSETAAAALRRVGSTEYDAIVADIKMPGMDGLQLLGRIRELQPDTPTLLITGHGEHELAVDALRGGAHDYVQKPIDREYFIGSLTHAIERHRLSRKVAEHKHSLEEHARELQECLEDRTHELRELYRREAIARAELERTTMELEAAQRRRLDLMSVIAHELATPLTTLRGYTELLTRPKVKEATRDRAKTIVLSETSRMERLVQDLVDDSEPGANASSLQLGSCDLGAIVREQLEIAAARSRRHRLVLDAPDRLEMQCDKNRIAQVVANLLTNAIKYTPGGEVHVALRRDARQARLSFQDEGPGIPTENLSTIFEPRVQLQASGTRRRARPNGAGLGLSIARDIVQAHGGRIWAESRPGQGAAFHVVLPITSPRTTRVVRGGAGQPVSSRSW